MTSRVEQLSSHLSGAEQWNAFAASVGDLIDDVDTPSLLLDREALGSNIRKMRSMVPSRVSLRPHYKTHKSNDIAVLQLLEGANGLCCAKLFEAECLAYGSVSISTARELSERGNGATFKSTKLDILITNEVGIGGKKMARLGKLAKDLLLGAGRHKDNRLGVCVDGIEQVQALSAMAKEYIAGTGAELALYVELNHGGNRCGVDTPEQVVEIAKYIRSSAGPELSFKGIHAYMGTVQHVRKFEERKEKNAAAAEVARTTVKLLEAQGFSDIVLTGSGTGSFEFDILEGIYTEIQVGSYVFLDRDYLLNLSADGTMKSPFSPSLFILSSIISHQPPRVVIDAGWKSVDMFVCFPSVAKPAADVDYIPGGDEHGVIVPKGLRSRDGSVDPAKAQVGMELFSRLEWKLGEKLWLLVSHCDPTVNLHDSFVVVDKGAVVDIWKIARGPGL